MLTPLSIISLHQGEIAPLFDHEPTSAHEAEPVAAQKAQWVPRAVAAVIRRMNSIRFGQKLRSPVQTFYFRRTRREMPKSRLAKG